MQIVRTILWVLLAVALALFAVGNWRPVEVLIWDNLVLETKLPVLVITAFLLGLVPMWLAHRVAIWRLRRRLAATEPSLATQPAVPDETTVPPASAGA